jgi:hypothetical protein
VGHAAVSAPGDAGARCSDTECGLLSCHRHSHPLRVTTERSQPDPQLLHFSLIGATAETLSPAGDKLSPRLAKPSRAQHIAWWVKMTTSRGSRHPYGLQCSTYALSTTPLGVRLSGTFVYSCDRRRPAETPGPTRRTSGGDPRVRTVLASEALGSRSLQAAVPAYPGTSTRPGKDVWRESVREASGAGSGSA